MKTTANSTARSKEILPRIDSKWRWHYRTLLKLREHLMSDRKIQRSEVSERLEPHSLHQADSATDEFDREVSLAALSAEHDVLSEIDQALKRIKEGTYGICEQTHVPIPPERLRALPWTRFTKTAAQSPETIATANRYRRIGLLPGKTHGFSTDAESGETSDEEANDQKVHPTQVSGPSKKKR